MVIACPYCEFNLTLNSVPVGRSHPVCPGCARAFCVTLEEGVDPERCEVAELSLDNRIARNDLPKGIRRVRRPAPVAPTEPENGAAPHSAARAGELPTGVHFQPAEAPGTVPAESKNGLHPEAIGAAVLGVTSAFAADVGGQAATVAAPPTNPSQEATAAGPAFAAESVDWLAAPPADAPAVEPTLLGGYEVLRELGAGGMGAVFLARQVSLNRPVALKVMNPQWASDPVFMARFTREAYAAAQLVHHHIIQIYDFLEHDGIRFFSMEFVEGTSLGNLVRQRGKLSPGEAVGYALQAARGLRFAHQRGMVHRDVKPDNLLLNAHGLVKVADLGLVKTPPGTGVEPAPPEGALPEGAVDAPVEVTGAGAAMGSPPYMSPEQCFDAANVDARADIYSLGCTLYVLLTGRAPFEGMTAHEIMSKHATEPPVPPDAIVESVPRAVSEALLRMLAKAPAERQPDMNAVIEELEGLLAECNRPAPPADGETRLLAGAETADAPPPVGPNDEDLARLESCIKRFHGVPAARHRLISLAAFFGVVLAGFMISVMKARFLLAWGSVAMAFSAVAAYLVTRGLTGRSPLFEKGREVALGCRWVDWLAVAAGAACVGTALFLFGLVPVTVYFAVVGAGLATSLCLTVEGPLAAQRREALDDCRRLLMQMRLRGMTENELRLFVAEFGGRGWEEFFEELYGFDAKLATRAAMQAESSGIRREKFGAWREPLARWLDGILAARRVARERKLLEAAEVAKLLAEGVRWREAKRRAAAAAARLVEAAAELRADSARAQARRSEETTPTRLNVRELLDEVEKSPPGRIDWLYPFKALFGLLLGARTRFLLGALLLVGSALWVRQNLRLPDDLANISTLEKQLPAVVATVAKPEPVWPPLRLSGLPPQVGQYFDHLNTLAAALLVLGSAFATRTWRCFVLVAAAAVTLFGYRVGLPEVEGLRPHQTAAAVGLLVVLVGYLVGKARGWNR